MSNPEQPTNPEPSDAAADLTPPPTELPPASELPESVPLASEHFDPATAPAAPAETFTHTEEFTPAATFPPAAPSADAAATPPVDPDAATQVFPGTTPEAPVYPAATEAPAAGGPGAPVAPGAPYGEPQQFDAQPPMNTLAIVAFIGSFFVGLVGIICGFIALKQIKRDGTRGRGLALAGTIIGFVSVIGGIIGGILLTIALVAGAGLASTASDDFIQQLEEETGQSFTDESATTPGTDAASSEFCAVLENTSSIDFSDNAAISAAYQDLADNAPSPESAALYQRLADLTLDPTAALDDPDFDITAFQAEVEAALSADAMSCM